MNKEIYEGIIQAIYAQSLLEVVAVVCAIIYLVLAVKENIWCWLFAFISTAIYIYLFYQVVLFSESLLNVYYLFMAIYGWRQWHNSDDHPQVKIIRWPKITHFKIWTCVAILVPVIGIIMQKLGASYPYLDAFVSILAVIATVMLAKKVFEHWYYWLIIDSLSIWLFWQKQLYLSAILFVIYIGLVLIGIKHWKTLMHKQK